MRPFCEASLPPCRGNVLLCHNRLMPYDREASEVTTQWIPDREFEKVEAAAADFSQNGWFPGVDPLHFVKFAARIGLHPAVLARPEQYRLSYERKGGRLFVSFYRPKKRGGMKAAQELNICSLEKPEATWIPEFIDGWKARPYSTQHINRYLHALGEAAGVPLSMRRFRHTCGVRVARKSKGDLGAVVAWLNCSPTTAAAYLRVARSDDPRMAEIADALSDDDSESGPTPPGPAKGRKGSG